jgi:hypothetical protein
MNRETWLEQAVEQMAPWFEEKNSPLPDKILASCGWPKAKGGKARAIGQCFDPIWTEDGTVNIFICPTVSDPVRVLDILLHELCHASVGTRTGHSGPFVKLIREFGLVGKATATWCDPKTPLYATLSQLSDLLGPYPHTAMRSDRLESTRPPGGGWVKFVSPRAGTGYILRVSPKSLAEHGAPQDPWGNTMRRA